MQTRTVFLFSLSFCVLCAIISEAMGGGKGGGRRMEKMKKCGDGDFNVEEAFKGRDECMAQYKNDKKDDAESRRRRSPEDDDGDGDGGKKKRKGKGGKHGHGGHGGRRNVCAMVCLWKNNGVLDSDGKFSESGAQEYVNKVYPEAKRSAAFDKIKSCGADYSSKFSMDDNCSGYKDFKRCIFKGHAEVCELKRGKHGKGDKGGGHSSEEEE